MIIFFEAGRLGNQLFQYCGLKKFKKKGPLFLVGMNSLKSMFPGIEVAGRSWLESLTAQLIYRLGTRRLNMMSKKIRLIGLIKEYRPVTGREFRVHNGLLKNIYYCDTAFFQSEKMIDHSIASKLQLKSELIEYASNIFKKLPIDRTKTFFVHVRRGDYTQWPSPVAPAVLPLKWYQKQMDLIRARYDDPFFIVVSDDAAYAAEMFGGCRDVFVSCETEEVDFALMTQCYGGGILSASSFSWWGAYFVRRANGDALLIAPLYWAGHRWGKWFPEGIETSWLNYAAV